MEITTENLPIIVAAAFFLFAIFIITWIALSIRHGSKRKAVIDKIKHKGVEQKGLVSEAVATQTETGIQNKLLGWLGAFGKRASVGDKAVDYDKMRPLFLKAGIRRENAPAIFWGAKLFFLLIFPAGFFLTRFFVPTAPMVPAQIIALVAILAIFGFYLPNLWIRFKIARRKEAMVKGFPDALDLMVVCVEAGMGLDSTITRVSKEMEFSHKILSEELQIYNFEMRAGKLRRDALKNLAMRTDLQEVSNLTTLLIQTDKFGTSIGQALKVYSDTMRTQRFQRAEEKAAKLPVKLIFPLILFIFPALFVVILGPAAINIYRVIIKGGIG